MIHDADSNSAGLTPGPKSPKFATDGGEAGETLARTPLSNIEAPSCIRGAPKSKEVSHDSTFSRMEGPTARQARATRRQYPHRGRRNPHASHEPAAAHDGSAPERRTVGGVQRN